MIKDNTDLKIPWINKETKEKYQYHKDAGLFDAMDSEVDYFINNLEQFDVLLDNVNVRDVNDPLFL